MAGIIELVKKMENLDPSLRGILYEILEEVEKQREEARKFYVAREEFEDLKRVVKDLAERVGKLTDAVKELAEAQKRTEERVEKLEEGQARLERALAELAEAQKRTEEELKEFKEETRRGFEEVWQAIRELAEAQKRTEERVGKLEEGQARLERALETLAEEQRKLAEAQRRTDEELKKLAEAQRRTEEELRKLSQGLRRTREEVGGLSRTMAYALENEAFRYLPTFLEKKYGFRVEERFVRTFVDGEEINFLARGRVDGEEVYLVGETVLRLMSAGKFRQLRRKAGVVEEKTGRRVIPFVVTHFAHPRVLEKAKETGIIVVQSFEWI